MLTLNFVRQPPPSKLPDSRLPLTAALLAQLSIAGYQELRLEAQCAGLVRLARPEKATSLKQNLPRSTSHHHNIVILCVASAVGQQRKWWNPGAALQVVLVFNHDGCMCLLSLQAAVSASRVATPSSRWTCELFLPRSICRLDADQTCISQSDHGKPNSCKGGQHRLPCSTFDKKTRSTLQRTRH